MQITDEKDCSLDTAQPAASQRKPIVGNFLGILAAIVVAGGPFLLIYFHPSKFLSLLLLVPLGAMAYSLFIYSPSHGPDDDKVIENKKEFRKFLFRRMEIVADARFAAAERLELRAKAISLVLSLLAAEAIMVSIVDIAFEFEHKDRMFLQILSLLAAVFVLVLSLYQFASRDEVNSEKCLQNGMKISDLRRRLALAETDDIGKLVGEYDNILKECGVNHDRSDFVKARIVNGQYKDGTLMRNLDNLWIVIRRVPPLAFVSWTVFIIVAAFTITSLSDLKKTSATVHLTTATALKK